MSKKVKLLTLIGSIPEGEWRRNAARDTWLSEEGSENAHLFLMQEAGVPEDEIKDTISCTKTIFSSGRITLDTWKSVSTILGIDAEYIMLIDDLSYIWVKRLMPYLDGDEPFIGLEHPTSPVYIIKTSELDKMGTEDLKTPVEELMKQHGYTLFTPENFNKELVYPKDKNSIIASLGIRADKVYRLHSRRNKPHVALCTIAIGRYDRFFGGWYEAMQEYFLPDCTRRYYVWTDNPDLPYVDCDYTTVVPQENLGWPGNTLHRFAMYLQMREELELYDFVAFTQVTSRMIGYLREEDIIPGEANDWLTVFRNVDAPKKLTYDPNKKSAAYIPKGMGSIYAQGGAYLGRTQEFMQLCEACVQSIRFNQENNVSEYLNDESHLNKYILTKTPKESWLRFWWPPLESQKDRCKLFTLEKRRFGGFNYLRVRDEK